MQLYILATALLASVASAADLCGATGSNCNGNRFCCPGIVEGGCCTFGGQANSVEFKLPRNSRGQAWVNTGCSGASNVFSTQSGGTFCQQWSSRRSARWLVGTGLVKAKREPAPFSEEECVQASQVITARGEVLTIREAEERGIRME